MIKNDENNMARFYKQSDLFNKNYYETLNKINFVRLINQNYVNSQILR